MLVLYNILRWIMHHNSDKVLFPIGRVSEKTGVNSVTLRAWERRYGLIKPQRTPKGHRLYSQADVELINNIVNSLQQGLTISRISERYVSAGDSIHESTGQDLWIEYRQRFITAITRFDEALLDACYNEAMSLYPVEVVTEKLIEPLLLELGMRWQKAVQSPGNTPIAEEHFFSVFMRNKLGARFHHRNIINQGPKLLLACLPGELHEFGLLLFALAAHSRGYRIVLLGADMPLTELPLVIQKTGADAVVLSGSETLSCDAVHQGLAGLINNTIVPVYIGGKICVRCEHDFKALSVGLIGANMSDGLVQISQHFNV